MINLPSKLGDIIRLAINDLERCESTPGYRVKMAEWHRYVPDEDLCYVSLAGVVMANTLQVPRDVTDFPALDFEEGLGVLDLAQAYVGTPSYYSWVSVVDSLEPYCSGIDQDSPAPDIVAANYDDDPDQFKVSLADLADHFDQLDVEFID